MDGNNTISQTNGSIIYNNDGSIDTLQITGITAGSSLALSSFDAKVTSIEKLDILDTKISTLTFGLADIQAMVDNGNTSTLTIRKDSGDILSFTGAGDTVLNNLGGSTYDPLATHYVFTNGALTATLDFVTV